MSARTTTTTRRRRRSPRVTQRRWTPARVATTFACRAWNRAARSRRRRLGRRRRTTTRVTLCCRKTPTPRACRCPRARGSLHVPLISAASSGTRACRMLWRYGPWRRYLAQCCVEAERRWTRALCSSPRSLLRPFPQLYVAYRYAPFGTASPIFTQPPVDVPPKGSKPLRNGFTSFELTATYDHIMNAFVSQGLLLELHNQDAVRQWRAGWKRGSGLFDRGHKQPGLAPVVALTLPLFLRPTGARPRTGSAGALAPRGGLPPPRRVHARGRTRVHGTARGGADRP